MGAGAAAGRRVPKPLWDATGMPHQRQGIFPQNIKKKKTKKLSEAEPLGWLSPGPRTRDETLPGSFPLAPAGRPDSAGRQESPSSPCFHVPTSPRGCQHSKGVMAWGCVCRATEECTRGGLRHHVPLLGVPTLVKVPLCHGGDGPCRGGDGPQDIPLAGDP